jgi:hypothetical protein
MKLFEYWTELPKVLSGLFQKKRIAYLLSSEHLYSMTKKIIETEKLINSTIKIGDLNLSEENESLILKKLNTIRQQKESIAIQCVKKSINLMNQLIKSYESVHSFDKEALCNMRILLQLTRSITSKCEEELREANIKDDASLLSDNTAFTQEKTNTTEFEGKYEFFEMIKIFTEKIQASLYHKTTLLMNQANYSTTISTSPASAFSPFASPISQPIELNLLGEKRFRDRKDTSLSIKSSSTSRSVSTYEDSNNNDKSPKNILGPCRQELINNESYELEMKLNEDL